MRQRRQKTSGPSTGPVRMRLRAWIGWLLALIGQPRWGLPIVGMAALVGIPPLYAVALLAGATKMRAIWFFLIAATGRIGRFLIVALGIGGLAQWLI